MRAVRRHLRACAWIGLLAMAALAAGPTVSRLLLPGGGAFESGAGSPSWAQPAAATPAHSHDMGSSHHHHEMVMAPDAQPAKQHPPAHQHSLEHCGLCVVAAHAVAFVQERPAPAGFVECARPASDRVAPALPRLRCDWSPASSRGPPRRS